MVQVGRTGCAVGIDTKAAAVQLARGSVQSLIRADAEYARQAAPMRFHAHNVFMPSMRHKVTRGLPAASVDVCQCRAAYNVSTHPLCCSSSLWLLTCYPDAASLRIALQLLWYFSRTCWWCILSQAIHHPQLQLSF